MDTVDFTRFLLSFAFVIGLFLGLAWLLKRFGIERRFGVQSKETPQLTVEESLMIDPRRRLVLIRRGGKHHLLLLGQTQDLLIESYDDAPLA